MYNYTLIKAVKGLGPTPNLGDRFVQYGIKVSFWGAGTLKIVIYVENYPQKRCQSLDNRNYTLTILRDFQISKIRARHRLGNVETSLACASDYALESN